MYIHNLLYKNVHDIVNIHMYNYIVSIVYICTHVHTCKRMCMYVHTCTLYKPHPL